jgi:urease accessory protein
MSNLLLLQIADSAFPMGSFAHSGGMEAAWNAGYVKDTRMLREFLDTSLRQTQKGSLPFAVEAHRMPEAFVRHDRLCDAFLNNHVANRASRSQGRSFLSTAEKTWYRPGIQKLRQTTRQDRLPCHLATVWGTVFRYLGLGIEDACQLLMFITLRDLISSAVRLSIIGPLEGQKLQSEYGSLVEELAAEGVNLGTDDIAQTAPVLDLLQGAHDRLYSRLFQS